MSRLYWVDLTPTEVSGSIDLVELIPAVNKPVRVLETRIGQTTDFGDAAAEHLTLLWVRGHTVGGSGGVAVTPTPVGGKRTAAGFTATAFNTTPASGGTSVKGPREFFNIAAGVRNTQPIGQFEANSTDGTLVLRIIDANTGTAPLDPLTIHGSVLVEEMGN